MNIPAQGSAMASVTMSGKCSEYEHFDPIVSLVCMPCSSLCCRGEDALKQCIRVCTGFFRDYCMSENDIYRYRNASVETLESATNISCTTHCFTAKSKTITTTTTPTTIPANDPLVNVTGTSIKDDMTSWIIGGSCIAAILLLVLVIIALHRGRNKLPGFCDALPTYPHTCISRTCISRPDNAQGDDTSGSCPAPIMASGDQISLLGPTSDAIPASMDHQAGAISSHDNVPASEADQSCMPSNNQSVPASTVQDPEAHHGVREEQTPVQSPSSPENNICDNEETPLNRSNSSKSTSYNPELLKQTLTRAEIQPRTEQPPPNDDENETPLKTTVAPMSAQTNPRVEQPPPNDDVNETPLNMNKMIAQTKPRVEQPPPNYDENETSPKTTEAPMSVQTTLDLVNTPMSAPDGDATTPDDRETPLFKLPLNVPDIPADLREQSRLPGRELSEEHKNPSEPATLQYQEEVLDSLQVPLRPVDDRQLLSIDDSLLPEEWEPAATRMTKFEVTYVLDMLQWVRQYMLDENKIDVFVDFDGFRHLTYLVIIEILKKLTMWDEMDFRIREMLPSEYFPMAGKPVLSPGAEITIKADGVEKTAAIGTLFHCPENNQYYAVTAGHCIKEGQVCHRYGQRMGRCVLSMTLLQPDTTIDIAVIQLEPNFFELDNTVMSASAEQCGFRLPATQQEVCDMECWKVQRKSREMWQYGFLRYAVFTNKDHALYRVIAVVRTAPQNPVIVRGDCGSLVTSLPRSGELVIYGMFMGRLTQQSDDGAEEPVEWYIAFPFKEALEMISRRPMFAGKTLNIVLKEDHG